jgi:hypothetical protein
MSPGNQADDAKRYQEKAVKAAIVETTQDEKARPCKDRGVA